MRLQMRLQIRNMYRKIKAISMYVAYDQIEVMTLADGVVLSHVDSVR